MKLLIIVARSNALNGYNENLVYGESCCYPNIFAIINTVV